MKSPQENRPVVSFVVIAYNEEAGIGECLRSIVAQIGVGSFEIVVVDDASVDRTVQIVTEFAAQVPDVILVRHPKNRGRGAARHSGLASASGDLIAMVDADVVLPADWYCRGAAALEKDGFDAVGGVMMPDGDVTYLHNRFRLTPRPTPHSVKVSGSNGLYRRTAFDLVTIDPTLREGEDVALNKSMESAGLRTQSIGDLIVEHNETKGFGASLRWLFQSGIGATRQLARYREIRTPDRAFLGQLVTIGAGWWIGRRTGRPALSAALPVCYLATASAAHVSQKFEVKHSAVRFGAAVAVNSVLLGSYFAGRVTGIPMLLVHRFAPKTKP